MDQDYNDNLYDTDNVDVEEEMMLKDIQDEEEAEETEMEALQDQEEERSINKIMNALNKTNIELELGRIEPERKSFVFKRDNDDNVYTAIVLHKLSEDNYIFNVTHINNVPQAHLLKKFKLSELELQ